MQIVKKTRLNSGFSFIELIIVLVIVAILAVLSYPIYSNVLLKTRRAEAKAALHSLLMQQEHYYTLHNTYLAFDSTSSNSAFKWWSGDSIENSFYELQAEPCPDKLLSQCVMLTAIPGTKNVRSHVDPICGNLILDSTNTKRYSISNEPNPSCW